MKQMQPMFRHLVIGLLCLGGAAACADPVAIVIEPLRLINWSPASGAFCVDPNVVAFATFSADLDESTVTADNIQLLDASGAVPASLSYDAQNFTVSIAPMDPLAWDTLYTLVANKGIESKERGTLSVKIQSSFQTLRRTGCTPGVECQRASDCTPQICANIGICIDECVTDDDCFLGTCTAGTCIPLPSPDGAAPGGDPMTGDTRAGD